MSENGPLIITNGSSGISAIRRAAVKGEIISWDDVLHEGPVPKQEQEELRKTRAQFLSKNARQEKIAIEARLAKRDQLLRERDKKRPLLLCFEHDLYDQLQLIQILEFSRVFGNGEEIFLLQSDDYLGEIESESMVSLFDSPIQLQMEDLETARKFWAGFTSEEPHELSKVNLADLNRFPFLSAAKDRLCLLYPSADDGMSLEERIIVEIIYENVSISLAELFQRYQKKEDAKFMGDTFFMTRLTWMLEASILEYLETEEGLREKGLQAEWKRRITLTDLGKRLADKSLSLLDHGIRERWVGGVHLSNTNYWKWDKENESFIL